jgi:co-chaperonin GroES (HSP10)
MTETIVPLGFQVLLEMEEVKDVSAGGVFMGDVRREQSNVDIGYVRAFGNTAFRGFPGCDPESYPPSHQFHSMQPHQIWGINIGDKVEYHHLEGQTSRTKGYERFRVVPDSQIIIKIVEKAND